MQATLGHLQFNINYANISFYEELMLFLGWSVLHEAESMIGFLDKSGAISVWYSAATKTNTQDHDGFGLNHIGLEVGNQKDVDAIVEHLQQHNIKTEFETPRHRPEFAFAEGETYYQVMFHSPDNILFEIKYSGPKS